MHNRIAAFKRACDIVLNTHRAFEHFEGFEGFDARREIFTRARGEIIKHTNAHA